MAATLKSFLSIYQKHIFLFQISGDEKTKKKTGFSETECGLLKSFLQRSRMFSIWCYVGGCVIILSPLALKVA